MGCHQFLKVIHPHLSQTLGIHTVESLPIVLMYVPLDALSFGLCIGFCIYQVPQAIGQVFLRQRTEWVEPTLLPGHVTPHLVCLVPVLWKDHGDEVILSQETASVGGPLHQQFCVWKAPLHSQSLQATLNVLLVTQGSADVLEYLECIQVLKSYLNERCSLDFSAYWSWPIMELRDSANLASSYLFRDRLLVLEGDSFLAEYSRY